MKHLTVITLALGALLLLCSNCRQIKILDDNATPIPYTTLENYFVRNDVDCSKEQRLILYNKQDFERYFGMAATMGGQPTEINWDKQYVVAFVLPETNRMTSIHPIAVKADDNKYLVFSYDVKKGEKISYKMVPFAAVAIDKTDNAMQMTVFYLEK